MAFCSKCGAELEEGAKFCALCGAATEAKTTVDSVADTVKDKFNEFNNTADTTSEYEPADIESNKLMAVLSYLGILVLIPIFAAKESKFARFHANQGLVLWIAALILGVVVGVINGILTAVLVLVGLLEIASLISSLISSAVGIVSLVFAIIGIVNSVTGKAKELPVIGKIKLLK